ncbi:hypothetical protein P7K49_002683, partial [Saguinus oedipus]
SDSPAQLCLLALASHHHHQDAAPTTGMPPLPCSHGSGCCVPCPATILWAGCFAQAWNYPNPLKYMAANEDPGKKGNNCDSNSRGQA